MDREILEALDAYLKGKLTLDDFRNWLIDQTWDNPSAPPVAHNIEYLIDEAASGNYTMAELRDELNAVYQAALATA